MKIAQVAPLYESVPPKQYGGTERVVSCLTEELVRRGHDVTLYASGDSSTRARLVPVCPRSLRLDKGCIDRHVHHVRELELVFRHAAEFDVIHFHIDYLHFPLSRRQPTPTLTTLHGRLDITDLIPLYREFADMPVVSISDSQRAPLPWLNWQATVLHGLPEHLYRPSDAPGKYLAFLGRISPEKRPDRAIRIARRARVPLKIAAKVDDVDRQYFETTVKPLIKGPYVEFVGEIGDKDKSEFLGNAMALLFPIDWPEPFGLTMIESLACGTPVIAYRQGSVPEVIDHGVTGFIVDGMNEAVAAVEKVRSLGSSMRRRCREVFEQRFTAGRMARDYMRVYEALAGDPTLTASAA